MSSILKALRKLEEEKARRRQNTPDIARDILRGDFRRRETPAWILSGAIFLAVWVFGILIYWFAVYRISVRSPQETEALQTFRQEPPPAEEAPKGEVMVSIKQNAAPPEGAAPKKQDTLPAPEGGGREQAAKPLSNPRVKTAAAASEPGSASASVSTSSRERTPDPPSEVSRPAFQLSGIAYQSDPETRMAILNELPVMTGMVVDGARVEEILRDRVRLSFGDQRFEVRLEK